MPRNRWLIRRAAAVCGALLAAGALWAQDTAPGAGAGGAGAAGGSLQPVREYAPGELRVGNLATLQRIIVVDRGRPMPLDSFARHTLLRLSGRRTLERRPAIEWLARVLFTPNETHDDPIFLVDNPAVVDAMGLPARGRDRHSLTFLLDGLPELERLAQDAGAISEDNRTIVEQEILRLWNNIGLYANLLSAFAFTYPHPDFDVDDAAAADLLGLPGPGMYSYLDLALRRDILQQATADAGIAHAQTGAFSRTDALLLRLAQSVAAWRERFTGLPIEMMPVSGFGEARWLSPWQALDQSQLTGLSAEELQSLETELLALRDAQVAYLEGRQVRFDLAVRQFNDSIERRTEAELALKDPGIEVLYNRMDPYNTAKLLYGLGLLVFMASFLGFRTWGYRIAFLLLLVGFVPHTFGMILRMLITDRPPVTNLFETFVFVGWGSVVTGIVMEYLRKRPLGLLSGLVGGFAFFLLSGKFSADGDTMPVLQAVLDTNFWLSTHVLVITSGYMACCLAGIIGHVYMVQAVARPGDRERLSRTYKAMFGTLALGLTFSFVGTMLGGVWADQSWGRFWGWDPKENGALLIVLWCAILFHAKLGKMVDQFGMAAGSALLIIVVMLAWFGINLLGVGLHSYGFTEGVLLGLMAYIVLQLAVVGVLLVWYRARQASLGGGGRGGGGRVTGGTRSGVAGNGGSNRSEAPAPDPATATHRSSG